MSPTDFKQQQPFDYGLRTLRIAHRSWGSRAGWEADGSGRAKEAECTVHTEETVQEHVSSTKMRRKEKLNLELFTPASSALGGQEFKASLGYLVNLKPAWATRDAASET